MADNNLLDPLSGILFSDDQAKQLNEYVRTKIDSSLFLFLNYTPDIIKPYSYDGRYLMGVSNLYKLIKDSGWVLEKSDKILDNKESVKKMKEYIKTIHTLRTVQNHNIRNDNVLPELYKAEKWWSQTGVMSQMPVSEDDYKKALMGLEDLGSSLMKEAEDFVDNVSKLNIPKKEAAIKTWTDAIIDRYTKERNLFSHAIVIYQKYSTATNIYSLKKADDIIVSYFINDYYCLCKEERLGRRLYSIEKYKNMVDNHVKKKFKENYALDFDRIEDLINDIDNNKEKYINLFFDKELCKLIKKAVKEIKELEIDSITNYILELTTSIELMNEEGNRFKVENVKCFDLNS